MRADLISMASELAERERPFALAVVVRREPSTSAELGNTAIITENGEWHGWLGGSCIQPAVARVAREVLLTGEPQLLAFSPHADSETRPDITAVPMTCQSGGTVDVYVEPVLPPPRLLLFGDSPVVRALARIGKAMEFRVDIVDPTAGSADVPDAHRIFSDPRDPELAALRKERRRLHAVVATMGQRDEEAVLAALALEPTYLGVVASRQRYESVREIVLAKGADAEALDRISNPAGLEIGARGPEEIALSVLAEIVQQRAAGGMENSAAAIATPEEARDPVCGMMVAVSPEALQAEYDGVTYYFCCGGCRERFLAGPEPYLEITVSENGPARRSAR